VKNPLISGLLTVYQAAHYGLGFRIRVDLLAVVKVAQKII